MRLDPTSKVEEACRSPGTLRELIVEEAVEISPARVERSATVRVEPSVAAPPTSKVEEACKGELATVSPLVNVELA